MTKEIDNDLDDLNFDDEAGFDELSMGAEGQPLDRNPTTAVRQSFWNGIVTTATDTNNIEGHIRKAVPQEYVSAADDVRKHYGEMDKARRNLLAPIQKELPSFKRDINRLTPIVKRLVGERFGNKFDELTKVKEQSASVDPDKLEISSAMSDVFGAWRDNQLADRQADLADKFIEGQTEEQRFKTNYELLTRISNNLSKQTSFEEQVTLKLNERAFELQFKQYHLIRNLLRVTTEGYNASISELRAITKNTGLPDIIKRRNSENFNQLFMDEWQGRTVGSVVDFGTSYMTKWKDNIQKAATEKGQEIADAMSTVADAASTFAEMDEMQGEFGGERKSGKAAIIDMAAGGLGGSLVNKLSATAAKQVKKLIEENPKNAGMVSYLRYMVANKPKLLEDLVGRLADRDDMFGKVGEFLQDTAPQLEKNRERTVHDLADKATSEALWDRISRTTLVKIIPGWLSKIHHRLGELVLGEGNAKQEVYDVYKEDFITKEESLRNLFETIRKKDEVTESNNVIEKFITNLFEKSEHKETDLTETQRNILRDVVLDQAVNNHGLDPKAFSNIEAYQKVKGASFEDAEATRKVVASILAMGVDQANKVKLGEFSDQGTEANKLTALTRNLQALRRENNEVQSYMNRLHQFGNNQDLVDIGLGKIGKKGEVLVDHDNLRLYRQGRLNLPNALEVTPPPKPKKTLAPNLTVHKRKGKTSPNNSDKGTNKVVTYLELLMSKLGKGKAIIPTLNAIEEAIKELKNNPLKLDEDSLKLLMEPLKRNLLNVTKSGKVNVKEIGKVTGDITNLVAANDNVNLRSIKSKPNTKSTVKTFPKVAANEPYTVLDNNISNNTNNIANNNNNNLSNLYNNPSNVATVIVKDLDVNNLNKAISSLLNLAPKGINSSDSANNPSNSNPNNDKYNNYNSRVLKHLSTANNTLNTVAAILGEIYTTSNSNHQELMGRDSFKYMVGRLTTKIGNIFKAPFSYVGNKIQGIKDYLKDKVKGVGSYVGRGIKHVKSFVKSIATEISPIVWKPRDIYLTHADKPIIYGKDLAEGYFYGFDKENNLNKDPIKYIGDITGRIVDIRTMDTVITDEDYKNGLETRDPSYVERVGGLIGRAIAAPFKLMAWSGKKIKAFSTWGMTKVSNGLGHITDWLNSAVDVLDGSGKILLAKIDIEKGKYYIIQDGKKIVLSKISQIGLGPVYRVADDEIVLSTDQVKEGLYNKLGELIKYKSILGQVGKGLGNAASFAWKVIKTPFEIASKGLDALKNMFANKLIKSLLIHIPDNVIFQANTVNLYTNKVNPLGEGESPLTVDKNGLVHDTPNVDKPNTDNPDKPNTDNPDKPNTDNPDSPDSPKPNTPKEDKPKKPHTLQGDIDTVKETTTNILDGIRKSVRDYLDVDDEVEDSSFIGRAKRKISDSLDTREELDNYGNVIPKPSLKERIKAKVGNKESIKATLAKHNIQAPSWLEDVTGYFKGKLPNKQELEHLRNIHSTISRSTDDNAEATLDKWRHQISLVSGKKAKAKTTPKPKGRMASLASTILGAMDEQIQLGLSKFNKKKSIRGDSDGDGLRDGGWRSQIKRMQLARTQKIADKKERRKQEALLKKNKKEDKLGGFFSNLISTLVGGFGGITALLGIIAAAGGAVALASGAIGSAGSLFDEGTSFTDKAKVIGGAALLGGTKLGRSAVKGTAKLAWGATSKLGTFAKKNLVDKSVKQLGKGVAKFGAKRLAGAGLMAAGGAVVAPIAGVVLGIGLTLYSIVEIASVLKGWFERRSDMRQLEYLRMLSYGYYTGDTGGFETRKVALRYFEGKMTSKLTKGKKGVYEIGMDFDSIWEEYAGDFNLDNGDEGRKSEFKVWYYSRFQPVFYRWWQVAGLYKQQSGKNITLRNLDDSVGLDSIKDFVAEVLKFPNFTGDPLNVRSGCFDIPQDTETTRASIEAFVAKFINTPKEVDAGGIDKSKVKGKTKTKDLDEAAVEVPKGHNRNNPKLPKGTTHRDDVAKAAANLAAQNAIRDKEILDQRTWAMSKIVSGEPDIRLSSLYDYYVKHTMKMSEEKRINLLAEEIHRRFDTGSKEDWADDAKDVKTWLRKAFVPTANYLQQFGKKDDSGDLVPLKLEVLKREYGGLDKVLMETDADDVKFDLTEGRFRETWMGKVWDNSVNRKQPKAKPMPKKEVPPLKDIPEAKRTPIVATKPLPPLEDKVPTKPMVNRVPTLDTKTPNAKQSYVLMVQDLVGANSNAKVFFSNYVSRLLKINPVELNWDTASATYVSLFNDANQGRDYYQHNAIALRTLLGSVIFPMIEYLDERVGRLGNGFKEVPNNIFKEVITELKQRINFTAYKFSLLDGFIKFIKDERRPEAKVPKYSYTGLVATDTGDEVIIPKVDTLPTRTPKVDTLPTRVRNPIKARSDIPVTIPPIDNPEHFKSSMPKVKPILDVAKVRDYSTVISEMFSNISDKDFTDYIQATLRLPKTQRSLVPMMSLFRQCMPKYKNDPVAYQAISGSLRTLITEYILPVYTTLDSLLEDNTLQTEEDYRNTRMTLLRTYGKLLGGIKLEEATNTFNFNAEASVKPVEQLNPLIDTNPKITDIMDTTARTERAKRALETPNRPVEVKEAFSPMGEAIPSRYADLNYDPDNAYAKLIANTVGDFPADVISLNKLIRHLFNVSDDKLNIDVALSAFVDGFSNGRDKARWYGAWEDVLVIWLREQVLPAVTYTVKRIGRKVEGHVQLNRISGDDFDTLGKELDKLFGTSSKYHVTYKRRVMTFTTLLDDMVGKPIDGANVDRLSDVVNNKPLNFNFDTGKPKSNSDASRWWKPNMGSDTVGINPQDNLGVYKPTAVSTGLTREDLNLGKGDTEHKITDKVEERIARYNDLILKASQDTGVDVHILRSIIRQESAGNPNAKSWADCLGLMQISKGAASDMGFPTDDASRYIPYNNITVGSRYIRMLIKRYKGNVELALAAYNAGMGNVDKAIKLAGSKDPELVLNQLPNVTGKHSKETMGYVVKITNDYRDRIGLEGESAYDKRTNQVAMYNSLDPQHVKSKLANLGQAPTALIDPTDPTSKPGSQAFQANGEDVAGKQKKSYFMGVEVNAANADKVNQLRAKHKIAVKDDAEHSQGVKDALAWDTTKDSGKAFPTWDKPITEGNGLFDKIMSKAKDTITKKVNGDDVEVSLDKPTVIKDTTGEEVVDTNNIFAEEHKVVGDILADIKGNKAPVLTVDDTIFDSLDKPTKTAKVEVDKAPIVPKPNTPKDVIKPKVETTPTSKVVIKPKAEVPTVIKPKVIPNIDTTDKLVVRRTVAEKQEVVEGKVYNRMLEVNLQQLNVLSTIDSKLGVLVNKATAKVVKEAPKPNVIDYTEEDRDAKLVDAIVTRLTATDGVKSGKAGKAPTKTRHVDYGNPTVNMGRK